MQQVEIKKILPHQTYDLRHRVMWPNHPKEFIILPEDEQGVHFGLYVSKNLVSVVSLFVKGKEAQFRKFATKTSEQSKGYGSKLLSHLVKYASSEGIERIWCNARVSKTAFYKRFGFIETNVTYEKGGINFIVLEKNSQPFAK